MGFCGLDGVFRADSTSFTVLRHLLVHGEVKEMIEAFGLDIGSRDVREGVSSFARQDLHG